MSKDYRERITNNGVSSYCANHQQVFAEMQLQLAETFLTFIIYFDLLVMRVSRKISGLTVGIFDSRYSLPAHVTILFLKVFV